MYLYELGTWELRCESPEKRAAEEENVRKVLGPDALTPLPTLPGQGTGRVYRVDETVSDAPEDAGAVYEVNDTFMELRGAWLEEKRGLISFFALGFGVPLGFVCWMGGIWMPLHMLFAGTTPGGLNPTPEHWIAAVATAAMGGTFFYFFFRYGWRFIRAELFTQRHILVRFNRKTRQVHLHRPRRAGGIVTLPWDVTVPGIEPTVRDDLGEGGPLILVWPLELSGAGYDELAFVGPPLRGHRQTEALWEYIRRYMEDGPEAIPPLRRRRARMAWPWDSVRASLIAFRGIWRRQSPQASVLVLVMISPLVLLHSTCHWVSMLLCWRPRWPREIARAGQPGQPVPKLTVAEDFGVEIGANLRHNALQDRKQQGHPLPGATAG